MRIGWRTSSRLLNELVRMRVSESDDAELTASLDLNRLQDLGELSRAWCVEVVGPFLRMFRKDVGGNVLAEESWSLSSITKDLIEVGTVMNE